MNHQTKQNKLKIVGMDPSLRNWGLAIGELSLPDLELKITKVLTIHPDKFEKTKGGRKSTSDIFTAQSLFNNLVDHVVDADIVIAETPIGGRDAKAAFGYAVCVTLVGMLNLCLKNKVLEVSPFDVKNVVKKNATKLEMIDWAVAQHFEVPWKYRTVKGANKLVLKDAEHVADAIASIYASASKPDFKNLIKQLGK